MCFQNSGTFETKFLNATLDSFLMQHVLNPTCHVSTQRSSILDLVFTHNPNSIDNIEHFLVTMNA